jgi:nucleoside-diphosphate-sugar epimerase
MSKNILLTGITGNLGAYAATHFLNKGYTILAPCRTDVFERRALRGALAYSQASQETLTKAGDKLLPFKWDIVDKHDGIDIPRIDETWHFASTLKYLPKDREEIFDTNVKGLANVLHLHKTRGAENATFHYISTAFAAGKNVDEVPESRIEINEEMSFSNEYEHSKLVAENIVIDEFEKGAIAGNIYRPSIVVGDTTHGKLINYNGFYLAVKVVYNFKNYLIRSGDEQKDIIRIHVAPSSALNLIPINDVIEQMDLISASGSNHAIFNLVNGVQVPTQDAVRLVADHLQLKVQFVPEEAFREKPRSRNEKLVAYGLNYIMPYLNRSIAFHTSNSQKIFKSQYRRNLNPDLLNMMIRQYLKHLAKS